MDASWCPLCTVAGGGQARSKEGRTGDSYFYLRHSSTSTSSPSRADVDRVRCKAAHWEGNDGCGAVCLLLNHFVEQPVHCGAVGELLALINGRIMELVRLPCSATRIHQRDNSGHVTPGINWTGPQIEFGAKEEHEKETIRVTPPSRSR